MLPNANFILFNRLVPLWMLTIIIHDNNNGGHLGYNAPWLWRYSMPNVTNNAPSNIQKPPIRKFWNRRCSIPKVSNNTSSKIQNLDTGILEEGRRHTTRTQWWLHDRLLWKCTITTAGQWQLWNSCRLIGLTDDALLR